MKKIILPLAILTLVACEEPTPPSIDYVLFSGKVENTDTESLIIKGYKQKLEVSILEDGTFSDTLWMETDGYYEFYLGRERSSLLLKNGETVGLTLDAKEFDESIKYTGTLAESNNILAQTALIKEEFSGNMKELYALNEAEFLATSKANSDKIKSLLTKETLSETFKKEQSNNVDYNYNIGILNYPQYHPHFAKLDSFKISESFTSNLIHFVKDDEKAYVNSSDYRNLISTDFDQLINKIYSDSLGYEATIMQAGNEIENQYIKEELLHSYARNLLGPNEHLKNSYNFLTKNTTNEDYLSEYSASLDKLTKLTKGMPSPEFNNYENHAGGEKSLSDLKGKYVYIDVWATWCGPCIREIPSLKAVEKEFHGKNIQFVSASIDTEKAHDTWVNMVTEKELGGLQLIADNAWKSEFVQAYQINGIPRFILVDPEGNIVSADAPRPSDPKLTELFEGLNI